MGGMMGNLGGQGGLGQTALQGGLAGLAKGANTMQQQIPKQAAAPIQVPQAPLVDPSMFGQKKNSFFGQ